MDNITYSITSEHMKNKEHDIKLMREYRNKLSCAKSNEELCLLIDELYSKRKYHLNSGDFVLKIFSKINNYDKTFSEMLNIINHHFDNAYKILVN